MCGIVGKVKYEGCKREDIVIPLKSLNHRGPDEQNIFVTQDVVLGHTRLAIIDTQHGHQPMSFNLAGKNYTIVYNGEIYNYKELSDYLKKANIDVETDSDTEVLLKWIAYKGIYDGISFLNGMFSIAIYCKESQKLYLARDRMGIKPLYFTQQNNAFLFSSELESLVLFDGVDKRINQEGLEQFMYFGYPVVPNTMYEEIYELRPGCIVEYDLSKNNYLETRYWNIDSYTRNYQGTYEEAVNELDKLLKEVIEEQIVSDVGYGTFLSGGIDSSLVTSMVSRINKNNFNAYTVSFDDKEYDELPYAKMVSDKYKNINHIVYNASQFNLDRNFIDIILKHVGQPFADSSCIPTYLIAKEVKKNEIVILSGDGGDELFMGYETFTWLDKIDCMKHIPKSLLELVQYIYKKLPLDIVINKNLNRQINKAIKYSLYDKTDLAFSLNSLLELVDLKKIVDNKSLKWLEDLKKELSLEQYDSYTVLQRFLCKVKLSGDMLRKVDSMTMANSIEVRVPLLDNKIIDFALSLPINFLYRKGIKKSILRDVAKRYLPNEVIEHKKWGFSIPMHQILEKKLIRKYQYLYSKYDILNKESINKFYNFKENPDEMVHKYYSQYTIDHLNWMLILLFRWIERNGVKYE